MKNNEKVVIVGAGMAGLTAAAYLSKENYDVLLLERTNQTGGLVGGFEKEGFLFDTGPRAFVNSGMVKPILIDLGIEMESVNNVITIAVEEEMFKVESLSSIEEYSEMLKKLYPENIDEITKIMGYVSKLSKYTEVLYEFDNPNFVDYVSDKKVLLTKLLPWTFRFLYSLFQFNRYSAPMEDFLEDLTENQSLIDILTQFFFENTPTYFALGYFQVYLDYFYPKNGTRTLPRVVTEKVIEGGVEIIYDTTITNVLADTKKVVDSKGNSFDYDHLIWAGDLKTLYKQVDATGLSKDMQDSIRVKKQETLNAKAAESVFIMYLGVNKPKEYFSERGGEHMFYSPSRNGLGNINKLDKENVIENFDTLSKTEVLEWVKRFCEENTFEVSVPALRDASLSPKDQTGIMISCLFEYEIVKKIEDAGWIDEFKLVMENTIVDLFTNSVYKGFKEDLIFKMSSTPLTINRTTGNSGGAIVGWSFTSKAPVHNKLKDIPKSVLTPIPDVYQASQWAYAPAGVPIAMLTGWQATQKIIKKKK